MFKALRTLLILSLIFASMTTPAHAAEELQVTKKFPLNVPSNVDFVTSDVALPSSVVLGSSSKVLWGYKAPTFKNELGDSYYAENGIWSWQAPYSVKIDSAGRRASVTYSFTIGLQTDLEIYATVDGKTYSVIQHVNFEPGQAENFTREQLPKLPQDFKVEIENPDPGQDLQTVIRARVTGSGSWPTQDFDFYNDATESQDTVQPGEWVTWEIDAETFKSKGMNIFVSWRIPIGRQTGNSSLNIAPIFSRLIPVKINFGELPVTSENTSLNLQCSWIKDKNSFSCSVNFKSTATKDMPAPIVVQTRVDGKPWGSQKKLTLFPGKSATVSMPNLSGKNQDIQAVYSRNGIVIESGLSSWVTTSAASSKPFSEATLRSALVRNCSNLPSRFASYKFAKKGSTLNNYGEPLQIYGLQLLRVTVYNGDSYWQIGSYTSADRTLLDLWECNSPLKVTK